MASAALPSSSRDRPRATSTSAAWRAVILWRDPESRSAAEECSLGPGRELVAAGQQPEGRGRRQEAPSEPVALLHRRVAPLLRGQGLMPPLEAAPEFEVTPLGLFTPLLLIGIGGPYAWVRPSPLPAMTWASGPESPTGAGTPTSTRSDVTGTGPRASRARTAYRLDSASAGSPGIRSTISGNGLTAS